MSAVVMLVISDVDADARVQREAATLGRAGHDVTIIALAGTSTADYTVVTVAAEALFDGAGATQRGRFPAARRAARWLLLPQHEAALSRSFLTRARQAAAGLPADIVHAHDFETLALAHDLAEERRAAVVYDSHELWSERIRRARPTPLQRQRERAAERRLGAKADAVLTVGQEIADWMEQRFGWGHVTLVRNSFPALPAQELGATPLPQRPTSLLYAGRIAPGRDLLTLAAAAERLDVPVVIMGPGDPVLAATLAAHPGVEVRAPVAVEEVPALLRSSGVSLVTAVDGPLSYALSMPNKLFQAVQAGVPVVATRLPAQTRVVARHGLGELYDPGDVEGFVDAVDRLLRDWSAACARVAGAGAQLSWAADAERLLQVYGDVAGLR